MKKMLIIFMGAFLSLTAYANDPMGLSEYVIYEAIGGYDPAQKLGTHQGFHKDPVTGSYYHERRMTNHEVSLFQKVGFIKADGSVDPVRAPSVHFEPLPAVPQSTAQATATPVASTPSGPKQHKTVQKNRKQVTAQGRAQPSGYSKHPIIKKKPLPTSHQIASKTKTKHAAHPQSKGTVHVRPTNMPKNPSRDDIVRMQQHIQHIERQVAKALDLSLSAYAVAELPQATEGRSSVSFGAASADGESAVAAGYSSNFGAKHEYTVKISLSHAGHEEAVGAGIGYQW